MAVQNLLQPNPAWAVNKGHRNIPQNTAAGVGQCPKNIYQNITFKC